MIVSANGASQFGRKWQCSRAKRGAGNDCGLENVETWSPRRDEKIFSRLDEVLKDHHFTSEVMELSHCLKDQWVWFCYLYNEVMSHLPEDSERADERDRFNDKTQAYERYSFLIEQFLTRAKLQTGETKRSRALSVQEPGVSEEHVSLPRQAQSSVLTSSQKLRRSNGSSRSHENAAIESSLAEVRLAQELKRESWNSNCYS